jgi:transposase
MDRHVDDLTDEQWQQIEHLIPRSTARTGPRWRQLDSRFGPYQTVFGYFTRWRRDGVLAKVVEALQIELDKKGLIDWELWCVDGSNVRASKSAAGAKKKVSSVIRKSQPTTPWVAVKVDLAPNSTWLLTARAFPWPLSSRPGKSVRSRRHSRSSAEPWRP